MAAYSVAIVGTNPESPIPGWHATSYRRRDDCELVACADIVRENAEAFAEAYGIPASGMFGDHEEMLAEADPDVVSVVTPPAAHAPLVVDCVRSGVPDAVHCEKPMADTWGAARLMAQEANRRDVQLTFNHQRRFVRPWARAKELLEDGAIGDLTRVELSAPNFFDWGIHLIDLGNMFAGDRPAEWVIGQVDYREKNVVYGVHHENHLIANWSYGNGVHGFAATGAGSDVIGPRKAGHRLLGTGGAIEVNCGAPGEEVLQVRRDGTWEGIDCDGEGLLAGSLAATSMDGRNPYFERAIDDAVNALREGRPSPLRAENALNAAEIAFGAYESSRRRGRVDFPLEIDDHPLASMVEGGDLEPTPSAE